MTKRYPGRRAVTLVELLVVLVVLGISAGIVGLTLHTARPVAAVDPVRSAIHAARDSAIRIGRSVTVVVSSRVGLGPITAYPDGRVSADPALHLSELSGGPDAAH